MNATKEINVVAVQKNKFKEKTMASISFKNIGKVYSGGVRAVEDFNLDVKNEEFVIFIGPSGCGKTTLLRMLAGLEEITEGTIEIDGKTVNDIEPKDRDIAMVFQNYALYPHMNVYDNMAFALKMRKVSKDKIDERVNEVAEILGIKELLKRKPKQLSGGQRQRVALGRAIVRKPKVFLMDEPLSNLDAKLRVQTRAEIVKLHQRLGTTFIYVTHDQTEAMTMGDKIVVMDKGRLQQMGTPTELYKRPINTFVAAFLGSPQINLINCRVDESSGGDRVKVVLGNHSFYANIADREKLIEKAYIGKEITVGIRPENVVVMGDVASSGFDFEFKANYEPFFEGEVEAIENMGSEKYVYTSNGEQRVIARVSFDYDVRLSQKIVLGLDTTNIMVFDKESGNSII